MSSHNRDAQEATGRTTRFWPLAWQPRRDGRRWVGLLGVLWLVAALTLLTGPLGGLTGLGIGVLWFVTPAVWSVAVGHLAAASLLPADLGPVLLVLEPGFVGLLAADVTTDSPRHDVALLALCAAGLSLVTAGVIWLGPPVWQTGLLVAVLVGVALYGVHRYERVLLGEVHR